MHETQLDSAYSPVHHIAGRYDMCACFGISDGYLSDTLGGRFGIECHAAAMCRVGVARGYATVACGGVLAQADIDSEEKLGKELGEQSQSEDDRGVWVVGC